jgi:hypothetical protein
MKLTNDCEQNYGGSMKLQYPILVAIGVLSLSLAANAASNKTTYKVSVHNVMAGNGLSPYLVVALKKGVPLFEVSKPASVGIAQVAETGNTAPLQEELASNAATIATAKVEGGPLAPGETRSVLIEVDEVQVKKGATLNLISMIGKSNDSFIGVQKLPLFHIAKNQTYTITATNYDAGSEENTGNLEDFGPGGHPTALAEGRISFDRGLNPRGNAGDLTAWGPTAAIVKITRVK